MSPNHSPHNNTTKTALHLLGHNNEASQIKLRALDHQCTKGDHIIVRRSPSNTAQQFVRVIWLTKDIKYWLHQLINFKCSCSNLSLAIKPIEHHTLHLFNRIMVRFLCWVYMKRKCAPSQDTF